MELGKARAISEKKSEAPAKAPRIRPRTSPVPPLKKKREDALSRRVGEDPILPVKIVPFPALGADHPEAPLAVPEPQLLKPVDEFPAGDLFSQELPAQGLEGSLRVFERAAHISLAIPTCVGRAKPLNN